ncbi:MAG: class I SAM-dependent methyltransferase [Fuerstiella sp.]
MSTQELLQHPASSSATYAAQVAASTGKWWHDRYPEWSGVYAQIVRDRNTAAEQLTSGGQRLLDLGCGYGDLLYLLRNRYEEKHGVDPAPVMIEKTLDNLQRHGQSEGFFVRQGVAELLPYEPNLFDTVTMLDVFEHVEPEHRLTALSEVRRVLKPGGELILATPSRYILRFWNVVDNILSLPLRLLRGEPLRIWRFVNKEFIEEFSSRRELSQAVQQAKFELNHFERVSFYPAPETMGFLAPWLHHSYHIPFAHRVIAAVFRVGSRCRFLNQKMLIRCTK